MIDTIIQTRLRRICTNKASGPVVSQGPTENPDPSETRKGEKVRAGILEHSMSSALGYVLSQTVAAVSCKDTGGRGNILTEVKLLLKAHR